MGSGVAEAGEGAQVPALFGWVELVSVVVEDAVRARVRRLDAGAVGRLRLDRAVDPTPMGAVDPRDHAGAPELWTPRGGVPLPRATLGAAGAGRTMTAPASTSAKIAWQTSSTGRF